MTIGIDLTILQSAHSKRGVGTTLISFINNLPASAKQDHNFIFYTHDKAHLDDALTYLYLSDIKYEVRNARAMDIKPIHLPLLKYLPRVVLQLRVLRDLHFGDSRIKDFSGVDHFLQFNQSQPLPAKRKVRSTLILYDLIPYVLRSEYLPTYSQARRKKHSIKGSVLVHMRSRGYLHKARLITKRAQKLIAISETTKHDFVKYLGINPKKIQVCLLGIDVKDRNDDNELSVERHTKTGWGYVPITTVLSSNMNFILFSGGVDSRRQLVDLVAAFNNLRAQGHDIKLVLTGDDMRSPTTVPNDRLRKYFTNTSYLDDIFFMGFVSRNQQDWLYRHALAFVYPSLYEGFGLPVLEAMKRGCPVITYKNSSIAELAGEAAIFADGHQTIFEKIIALAKSPSWRQTYNQLGKKQAENYSWEKTSTDIIKLLD
jgi:glycosyltransferase involved in cell wall biosynthesis